MTYNISWFGNINEQNQKYSQLDTALKTFLVPVDMMATYNLPLLLLGAGVNVVTPSSVNLISDRLELLYSRKELIKIAEFYGKKSIQELLSIFLGVTTNGPLLSNKDWVDARVCTVSNKQFKAELTLLNKENKKCLRKQSLR